jgi:hypothetical protein
MTEYLGARSNPSVLFSGYHGDKVWERDPGAKYVGDVLVRGDSSGLNLSEIRLVAGFVNLPVPFIEARSTASINRVSNSAEMEQWRLGTNYDRPIPRRILESEGVPRDLFGTRKKAVIDWYREPHNRQLRSEFMTWVERNIGVSSKRLLVSNRLSRWLYVPWAVTKRARRSTTGQKDAILRVLGSQLKPEQWLFVWSANLLADGYSEIADLKD